MSSSNVTHMSPSMLIISMLLLSSLLPRSIGIRLDDGFKLVAQKFHEKNGSNMERSGNLCKEGHCTGSTSRKLNAMTGPTSTGTSTKPDSRTGEAEVKFIPSSQIHPRKQDVEYSQEHLVDLLDIAEMDYSPARRKTPIHN